MVHIKPWQLLLIKQQHLTVSWAEKMKTTDNCYLNRGLSHNTGLLDRLKPRGALWPSQHVSDVKRFQV